MSAKNSPTTLVVFYCSLIPVRIKVYPVTIDPVLQDLYKKFTFLGLFTILVLITILALTNLPNTRPDTVLRLEQKINNIFERATLPIKILRLSRQPSDEKILMPVYDVKVSEITDTWHAPRGNLGERLHEGQDIFAPEGTPIFSATKGYITKITNQTIGGNSVFIIGAGGRTYFYTHLERFPDNIRIGQPVTTDTVVGFVGKTGNAAATPPHLHFGVYEPSDEATNPLPLLTDRF